MEMTRTRSVKWWQFHHALLRYKFLVVSILILGTFGSIVYTSRIPKEYRATSSDMVDSFSSASSGEFNGVSTIDMSRAHKILAESKPVRDRIILQSGISLERSAAATFEARVDGILIYFSVTDGDYNVAKKLANAWASGFIQEIEFREQNGNTTAQKSFSEKYNTFHDQWLKASKDINDLRIQTGFSAEGFSTDPIHATVAGYNKKKLDAEAQLNTLDKELSFIKDPNIDASNLVLLTYVQNDAAFLERWKKFKETESALSDVMIKYKKGPEWTTAEDQQKEAKLLLDRSRDQLAGAMALKRQEIADELAKASAAYGTERGKLDTLIAHQGRHAALTFEIESAKRGMDQVTDRMHEIGLQKINNSKVVKWEEAEENPNPVPFKPNWRQNIMFGVILSFVLAGALVAGLEQIDDTVRTPRDIEQRIGAVVLGAVPACGRKSMDRDGYFLAKRQTSSIAVDCMRGIHIGLEVGRKGAVQNGALVITVTSAVPEDGKSFITSNLGILFASLGRRVLVVDADLRKASLSKAFDAGDRNGFFEILTSQKWTKEFAIIETKSGYSLLSAGRTKNSVSESLHPESVSNMLELMRKDFDVIIFDTPPVLALPDACVLGQMSDITVLVTRSRHTQMAQIERAAASLFTAKVKELSFVVNGLDAADAATDTYGSGYGYGYGNGYGHGYGYGREDSGGKHKKLPKPPNVGGMTDPNEDDEDDQN